MTREQVLGWAGRAEAGPEHPLARTILDAVRHEGPDLTGLPESTEPVPDQGIAVATNVHRVVIGNPAPPAQCGSVDMGAAARAANEPAEAGRTPTIVTIDETAARVIGVADEVRPGAAQMGTNLHAGGAKRVVRLTGDSSLAANVVGSITGVYEIHASFLPEDKLDLVFGLQAESYVVAMVGDGVNDAHRFNAA
ncbi:MULTISPECIES: HAD family hydrolase [unclassified Cryobacterium]|uniref:HAD family hydrolase n=1 Tax=unclassified Cryobacterium TaxID=2649013 RepID=UPI000CE40873|nr:MULTISPECIES: HAD family hydrolase [unclassified Cryobacterium]